MGRIASFRQNKTKQKWMKRKMRVERIWQNTNQTHSLMHNVQSTWSICHTNDDILQTHHGRLWHTKYIQHSTNIECTYKYRERCADFSRLYCFKISLLLLQFFYILFHFWARVKKSFSISTETFSPSFVLLCFASIVCWKFWICSIRLFSPRFIFIVFLNDRF